MPHPAKPTTAPTTCALAPADEPRCSEPVVVEIVDRFGYSAPGCHQHAVRALRGIVGARVRAIMDHEGAAIAVHRDARNGR